MFIFREEYYLTRAEPIYRAEEGEGNFDKRRETWETRMTEVEGKAEIIIAKQRHGPTGKVELRFHAMATKFDNLEDPPVDSGYDRGR